MMARKREIQNEREIELERREEFSLSLPLWTTRPDLVEPMVLRFGFTVVLYSAVVCKLSPEPTTPTPSRAEPNRYKQRNIFSSDQGWYGVVLGVNLF